MRMKMGVSGWFFKPLTALVLFGLAGAAQAATIGQYSGNTTFWASSGNFSTIYSAATNGLNATIETGEDITAGNLANDNFFIVRNPNAALNASEVSALVSWVQSGGILMLYAESASQIDGANSLLSALHSGISVTSGITGNPYSQSGGFLNGADVTAGMAGQMLSFYNGNVLTGGTALANPGAPLWNLSALFRVDNIQLGKVYVFTSPLDVNWNSPGFSNTQFFLALLAQSTQQSPFGSVADVGNPEPATFGLAGLALAGIVYARRRK